MTLYRCPDCRHVDDLDIWADDFAFPPCGVCGSTKIPLWAEPRAKTLVEAQLELAAAWRRLRRAIRATLPAWLRRRMDAA